MLNHVCVFLCGVHIRCTNLHLETFTLTDVPSHFDKVLFRHSIH